MNNGSLSYRLNLLLEEGQIISIVLHDVGSAELDVVLSHSHIHLQISKTSPLVL